MKYIAIFLVLLCCFMGAASAAEDISTDIVGDSVDDAVTVDVVFEDTIDSKSSMCLEDKETLYSKDKYFEDDEQSNVLCSTNSIENASILGERDKDEIHVNNSGSLSDALYHIKDGGIIYLADSNYNGIGGGEIINCTLIGCNKDKVIFDNQFRWWDGLAFENNGHPVITFINITFKNPTLDLIGGKVFLNCTFINSSFLVGEYINHCYMGAPENYAFEESFTTNFTNCNFLNYTSDGSLVDIYRFSSINFQNCSFDNISAKSIVNKSYAFSLQDAINFYGCSFNNVNVKGIVDVPVRTNPYERYRIEECTYDGFFSDDYAVLSEDNRDYINATKPRLATVLSMGFDDEGNLIVNVSDVDGNPLANYDVFISINGDELTPYVLDDEGNLTLDLIELAGAGEINVTALFEDADDYKESSASISTFLVVKTVIQNVTVEVPVAINPVQTAISASDLSATANTAKSWIVALKDANGNALSNKAIKVLVNGKESNIVTDSNGVAKINVNYANAGTYHYVLSFLGDNDYKACLKSVKVTVAKQAVKATFAKKTFKVKSKSKKISFTLKDAKGKAIKGKKITFTVNKKIYSAKTNAKGVATVKVKLAKKGKYVAVAKFAGDNAYKAISKKAKITIK